MRIITTLLLALKYVMWRWFLVKKEHHQKGFVDCDNAKIYFESYGRGDSLILLHGGLVTMQVWYCQLPVLCQKYRVISIDLRGHGRSTLGTDKLTYRLMADDIAKVMEFLKVQKGSVIGWSDGGNTGLLLALHYPALLNCLIAISANFNSAGVNSEKLKALDTMTAENHNIFSRISYQLMSSESGSKSKSWKELWSQVTEMWKTRPQLTYTDLQTIKTPTLLLVGEFDDIKPKHTERMYEAISNSQIKIIKNAKHGLIHENAKEVNNAILNFLSEK